MVGHGALSALKTIRNGRSSRSIKRLRFRLVRDVAHDVPRRVHLPGMRGDADALTFLQDEYTPSTRRPRIVPRRTRRPTSTTTATKRMCPFSERQKKKKTDVERTDPSTYTEADLFTGSGAWAAATRREWKRGRERLPASSRHESALRNRKGWKWQGAFRKHCRKRPSRRCVCRPPRPRGTPTRPSPIPYGPFFGPRAARDPPDARSPPTWSTSCECN